MKGYFDYIHSHSDIFSLQELIDYKEYINLTPESILAIDGNSEAIYSSYNKSDRETYKTSSSELIRVGTKIKLPNDCINMFRVNTEGNRFVFPSDDSEAFIASKLKEIVKEKGYKSTFKNKNLGSLYKKYPDCSVWIWCKSLGGREGEIFNLSPFIQNITTNSSENGSNFNITLPPITAETTKDGWAIKKNTLSTFLDERKNENFIHQDSVIRYTKEGYKRSKFLFHNLIGTNDIIFIRFEKMDMELDREGKLRTKISKEELKGKVFDQIGLVDTNSLSYNAENASVRINITGRCLSKLLIEDGTHWVNIPNLKPIEGIFNNDNYKNFGRPIRRFDLVGTNNNPIAFFNNYKAPRLEDIVGLIFSSLATIEICNDSLFSAYGDEISTYRYFDATTEKISTFKAAGIWQIVKVLIDKSVKDRLVVDTSISTHDGSLLNGLQKYVQKPFIEILGDTYGDQFYFTIRKPPFDAYSYGRLADFAYNTECLRIKEQDVLREHLQYDDNDVYCWYKLTPQGYINGTRASLNNFDFNVVYFREYNEIWGNRSLDIVTNLVHYKSLFSTKENDESVLNVRRQIFEDLKFLVQTNAYMPFTRKGTLTIKGDRRIKRGMCIYHEGLNEVFYVDSVSQQLSTSDDTVERETTLNVSRGMVYLDENGRLFINNYFSIINYKDKDYTKFEPSYDWSVNQDIFNLLLKRRQFVENSDESLNYTVQHSSELEGVRANPTAIKNE